MEKLRYSIECAKEYNSDAKDFLLVESLNQTISNLGIGESEFTVTCLIDDLTSIIMVCGWLSRGFLIVHCFMNLG
jgi:hypothetical protein